MNPNRPARLNRTLLALAGLLLVASGLFVLGVASGWLIATFRLAAPQPTATLPTAEQLPGWAAWIGAIIAVIVGLLALRWLIAQTLRRPPSSTWQLAPDTSAGTTHIDSVTAAQPLAEEIKSFPGVHEATARLTGQRRAPQLYLRVSADERADLADLRHRIDNDAVPRLAAALDLPALPVDLLLRLEQANGARAR